MVEKKEERPRAVILGVQFPSVSDGEFNSSLAELTRLATTLGLNVVDRITQKRDGLAAAAVVGSGKLKELAKLTGGTGIIPSGAKNAKSNDADASDESDSDDGDADEGDHGSSETEPKEKLLSQVVVVDHDLTPSQARNLERATGAEVLDRTAVILSIFQRHARTREAKLQVEIARLVYMAPRLRETGAGADRQRGGIGGKGAGESAVELDRRKVRDRIAELREELKSIEGESATRRSRRAEQSTVALVGYTNAGKSSLMRALTASDVYVADKLFATLDTTVRALQPETKPRILVSDTVGFIKKLPHDLVASFRSTLDEARDAHVLLHVVDASDVSFRSHMQVTEDVLREMAVNPNEVVLVMNKMDRVDDERGAELRREFPNAIFLSAKRADDIAMLHGRIVAFFEKEMEEVTLFFPYAEGRRVAEVHAATRVLSETHDERGTTLRVRGPKSVVRQFQKA